MANTVKNFRNGRVRIQSGDTPTPLERVFDFTVGDLTFSEPKVVNLFRSRGTIRAVTRGDEQVATWSFSAAFRDRLDYRVMRELIFPAFAETLTGLTPSANNPNEPVTFAYEQNSMQCASGETCIKLAIGVTPTSDNEFSEELGAADVNAVTRVEAGDGTPGSGGVNFFQPAADTDRDVVYDAVGNSTFISPGLPADCSGGVKTFKLIFDVYDVCDGFDPDDPSTGGTIEESWVLDNAYLLTPTIAEGEEADTMSFAGEALLVNGKIRIVPGGEP